MNYLLEQMIFSYYTPKSLENQGLNTSVTLKVKPDIEWFMAIGFGICN